MTKECSPSSHVYPGRSVVISTSCSRAMAASQPIESECSTAFTERPVLRSYVVGLEVDLLTVLLLICEAMQHEQIVHQHL
jgi:hypothetical protein